jgi:hypothetical protein
MTEAHSGASAAMAHRLKSGSRNATRLRSYAGKSEIWRGGQNRMTSIYFIEINR